MGLKPGQMDQLESFLQGSAKEKYVPQSGTVQGILTDMYKNFAVDLQTATSEEAAANRKYEDYMNEKYEELKQMEKDKAMREKEKLDKEAKLADNQQIYDDTTAQRDADIAFFDQTKEACRAKHD